jgi:hypothetical protein
MTGTIGFPSAPTGCRTGTQNSWMEKAMNSKTRQIIGSVAVAGVFLAGGLTAAQAATDDAVAETEIETINDDKGVHEPGHVDVGDVPEVEGDEVADEAEVVDEAEAEEVDEAEVADEAEGEEVEDAEEADEAETEDEA